MVARVSGMLSVSGQPRAGRKVCLRICVNQKHCFPLYRKPDAEIRRRGRLCHAAFLVAQRYYFAIRHLVFLLSKNITASDVMPEAAM